jgi:hypothetical protein
MVEGQQYSKATKKSQIKEDKTQINSQSKSRHVSCVILNSQKCCNCSNTTLFSRGENGAHKAQPKFLQQPSNIMLGILSVEEKNVKFELKSHKPRRRQSTLTSKKVWEGVHFILNF